MSSASPPADLGEHDSAALLTIAAELATEAGVLVRDGRRSGITEALTKSSDTDVATEWDRASEALLVSRLGELRANDAVVGEEGSAITGTSGISWLIDPIDGTTNYLYDLPGYAVSIAACDAAGPLAAAVYLPVTHELFTARRGHGAFRNGHPISCSHEVHMTRALIATGFSYLSERRIDQVARVSRLLPQVRDIRRLGAASVDLCYVAMGRLDAYYEEWLGAWDLAAGQLIAAEAGCLLGAIDGGPVRPESVLVATPALFEPLRIVLTER